MANQYMPSNSSGSSGMNYGQGSPSALASYEPKKTKPRSKASDTSKMNKVYKPKSSPGPAMNTLNLYGAPKLQTLNKYGSPSPRTKPESLNLYGAPKLNAKPKPRSNFNYTAPKADKAKPKANLVAKPKAKAKSKNVAGFKPGSIGANAISSFKKAYLGK